MNDNLLLNKDFVTNLFFWGNVGNNQDEKKKKLVFDSKCVTKNYVQGHFGKV